MVVRKKRSETFFFKRVIRIPIYFGNFIILFSNDPEKVMKTVDCQSCEVKNLYAHTFHNFMYNNLESFCVVFNFWDSLPITMGTIVHEVTHAGNRLMLSREFEPDWINDEAEAYLKSWMGDEIEKFMRKCNLL